MKITSHLCFLSTALLYASRVASQNAVQVDDMFVYSESNPIGIQYGGPWDDYNPNHDFERFNGSSHVINATVANFVFFFRGTGISWRADGDRWGGPMTLTLDGSSMTVSNLAPKLEIGKLIWSSSTLASGDHQIIATNPDATLMGVDYLEVISGDTTDITPENLGPGASNVPPGAILVDDSDSSISWTGIGWQTTSGAHFQGSMHSTNKPGDQCTFKFTGTAVYYFTDYATRNALVSISVDGGTPEKVQTASDGTVSFTQKLTWSKTGLTNGAHTVTITHGGSDGSYVGVDFFKYLPSSGGSGSSGSSSSSKGAGGSSSVPLGAVIGGVVGGVVLVSLLIALLIILKRRRNAKESPVGEQYAHYNLPVESTKEGSWGAPTSPEPQSALHYGNGGLESPQQSPTVMDTRISGHTSFSAAGYAGLPEV